MSCTASIGCASAAANGSCATPAASSASWRSSQVPLKDYKTYAKQTTLALCQAIETDAKKAGLYHYLNNCHESKEETALRLAAEHGRQQGLIAVLGCVEPCQVVQVRGNKETKKLELRIEPGKCLHYYHYYRDADYGLRYTRLQSWFPFTMHVGLNGRDWLARQMTQAGLGYRQKDNCFTWVEDWAAAQRLLDEQLTTDWASLLDGWAAESHPWLSRLVVPPVPYYWSVQEGEYATDIAFRTPEDLRRLYPRLVRYATGPLQSTDVLRFLGYRLTKAGEPRRDLAGEVMTTIKELVEGTCVKHRVPNNGLKMYDKFGQVLRLENLLIDVRDFKVFRMRGGSTDGPMEYLGCARGWRTCIAVPRSVRGSTSAMPAAGHVEEATPLSELAAGLGPPTKWKGRSVRTINPLAPEDVGLLEAVNRASTCSTASATATCERLLFADVAAASPEESRRRSAKGDAADSVAASAWSDRQGRQDPPLPGDGGGPPPGSALLAAVRPVPNNCSRPHEIRACRICEPRKEIERS